MKAVARLTIMIFILLSCQSQEINLDFDTLKFNIPGEIGPGIIYKGNYYYYFKTDNDRFRSGSNHQFYIIDKYGKINSKIDVPEELQTTYYDLYLKNETINYLTIQCNQSN